LVIAANRDEFYARPAQPPHQLRATPWVVGGQDVSAGGTWLGVNGYGVVAGILNRRSDMPPDPAKRSRGQLCLDALARSRAADAVAYVRAEPHDRYNPFNLLVADPAEAFVVGNGTGVMQSVRLTTGLHVLTNLDLDDMECPRLAKSYALFGDLTPQLDGSSPEQLRQHLRKALSDHSTPLDPRNPVPTNNLCMHSERFGTRSSTLLFYDASQHRFHMWHADGPPCRTDYQEVILPEPFTLDNTKRAR